MGADNKLKKSTWVTLDTQIEKGLKLTAKKLVTDQKKKNRFLVVADEKGNVKKNPAKDL